ncbi:DUF262 domain-containing protein [Streptomyces sp. 2R]|uniref:DUF262 domain-containing protein n=1 Tax=Streptomyces sp. 2R TaxID=1883452 RepID=UPI000B91666E|nr:DUF262 domain-containing protein [Streptomyces sp. 2R]
MPTIANAVPIGTLLTSSATPIIVPRVQRPYSWETGEAKELWDDIISFHVRYPGKTINSREYFMGALVGQADEERNVVEILDGQQRLATLTILLSVLRDKLAPEDPEAARTIQIGNIVKFVQLGSTPEYLLTLNKVDRVFFRQEVQEFPRDGQADTRVASHVLIRKVKEFFDRKFDECLDEEASSSIELAYRLHSIIVNNLKVVFIHSSNWDDVSDVFERLNDRGKGLSTLNLLRNHVLSMTPDHQLDDVEDFWEQVYGLSQTSSKVDAFLRHVWITHRGDVKKQSLFKEIKAVMATPSTKDDLKDPYKFSKNLASDAELYKAVLGGTHSDPSCTRWLKAIQTLQATSLLPAALSCVDEWGTAHDQAALLRSLVTTFVRFSVITGGDSSTLESVAYKVAYQVRGGATLEDAQNLLRPLLRSDEQVMEDFTELSIPNAKSGYQRHLLTELENYFSASDALKGEGPEKSAGDSSVLWIEHIYPQHPHAGWETWIGREDMINRLGNLTLVHKKLNATASNKPFSAKQDIYQESGLHLNLYLSRLDDWSPRSLDERQRHLAKAALSAWPRF